MHKSVVIIFSRLANGKSIRRARKGSRKLCLACKSWSKSESILRKTFTGLSFKVHKKALLASMLPPMSTFTLRDQPIVNHYCTFFRVMIFLLYFFNYFFFLLSSLILDVPCLYHQPTAKNYLSFSFLSHSLSLSLNFSLLLIFLFFTRLLLRPRYIASFAFTKSIV